MDDSRPGSLRAAIEAQGPRIVVFRVGGTIELQSGLAISNPFITIAGQTAPGGGVTLQNDPSNTETPLKIKTHSVIVQYIRSRRMADEWEVLYCFNPHDPADGPGDADGDGYTNVEEYLNGTERTLGNICSRLFLPFIVKRQPIFYEHFATLAL